MSPRLGRDGQTDAGRTGRPAEREAYLYDIPEPSKTLWDAKQEHPDNGGTRGAADIPVAEK